MKKILLICLSAMFIMSCGNSGKIDKQNESTETQTQITDESIVNVYYFHGKQRCKTCIAVGDIAKKTVETAYAGDNKVKFTEIETSDKNYEALVEKYEVSWNALIIAKGGNHIDITEEAFANALSNPNVLEESIKNEINKNL